MLRLQLTDLTGARVCQWELSGCDEAHRDILAYTLYGVSDATVKAAMEKPPAPAAPPAIDPQTVQSLADVLRGILAWYADVRCPGDIPKASELSQRLREARAALARLPIGSTCPTCHHLMLHHGTRGCLIAGCACMQTRIFVA